MKKNNKTYGFTIAVKELRETVPNLFRYVSAYKRNNNLTTTNLWQMFADKREKKEDPKVNLPEDVLKLEPGRGKIPTVDGTAMEGEDYNMCHFWSNFEIARFDFYRSKQYEDFFEMLDRSGGFWAERVRFPPTFLGRVWCTDSFQVGRCSRSLARGRCLAWSSGHSLLPRCCLTSPGAWQGSWPHRRCHPR